MGGDPAPVTSEQELALLLVGTRASRAAYRDRVRALARHADLSALAGFLRGQGMLTLIGLRLQAVMEDELPDHFSEQIETYARQARQQSVAQQMLTIRVVSALKEAGIRALPLKGPLLGERLYGDLGARVSADIDLLVGAANLPRAIEILTRLGYRRCQEETSQATRRPVLHERLTHDAELPPVELHWRVHWYEERFSADLLARSTSGPNGCLRPRPVDELAELLLLYARDGFSGLRYPADLAAWWDIHGGELDSDGIESLVVEYAALARALATGTLLAERLTGLPARCLLPRTAHLFASKLAIHLANWPLRGKESQISANISLVDGILSPPQQRWTVVRRNLQLPLTAQAWPKRESRSTRATAPWSSWSHAARTTCRYAIALWIVFWRGSWAPLPSVNSPDDER